MATAPYLKFVKRYAADIEDMLGGNGRKCYLRRFCHFVFGCPNYFVFADAAFFAKWKKLDLPVFDMCRTPPPKKTKKQEKLDGKAT